jgi:hypothetical protein
MCDFIPESLIKGHRPVCYNGVRRGIARVPLKSLLKLIRSDQERSTIWSAYSHAQNAPPEMVPRAGI